MIVILGLWKLIKEDHKLEASLRYTGNKRLAWAIDSDPLSKNGEDKKV